MPTATTYFERVEGHTEGLFRDEFKGMGKSTDYPIGLGKNRRATGAVAALTRGSMNVSFPWNEIRFLGKKCVGGLSGAQEVLVCCRSP